LDTVNEPEMFRESGPPPECGWAGWSGSPGPPFLLQLPRWVAPHTATPPARQKDRPPRLGGRFWVLNSGVCCLCLLVVYLKASCSWLVLFSVALVLILGLLFLGSLCYVFPDPLPPPRPPHGEDRKQTKKETARPPCLFWGFFFRVILLRFW